MNEYPAIMESKTSKYGCTCCHYQFHKVFICKTCGKAVCRKCVGKKIGDLEQICHWCSGPIPVTH